MLVEPLGAAPYPDKGGAGSIKSEERLPLPPISCQGGGLSVARLHKAHAAEATHGGGVEVDSRSSFSEGRKRRVASVTGQPEGHPPHLCSELEDSCLPVSEGAREGLSHVSWNRL